LQTQINNVKLTGTLTDIVRFWAYEQKDESILLQVMRFLKKLT